MSDLAGSFAWHTLFERKTSGIPLIAGLCSLRLPRNKKGDPVAAVPLLSIRTGRLILDRKTGTASAIPVPFY